MSDITTKCKICRPPMIHLFYKVKTRMGIIKLSLPPVCLTLLVVYLWSKNILAGYHASLIISGLDFLYIFVQCFRYGVFDRTQEEQLQFPSTKYYYKEYQCEYTDLKKKVMKELTDEDHNMLKSKAKVTYLAIYYDNPKTIIEKKKGRACAGFALQGEAEEDIGINKVLEAAKFKVKRLDECEAIAVKLPKIDHLSNSVAIIKTMSKLWNYATRTEGTTNCLFQWEESKTLRSGVFTGKCRNQYLFHSASSQYPNKPELNSPTFRHKKDKQLPFSPIH
eukprot:TRINITY_DN70894_c4_g1_i1.p1 TRINITY_DN70894_c4_g1~~TRINITY_DN70894_c4_g1_i1.p1  ORF type:complete len:278 (-),score=18.97 TRINITY_DN70894_c4_g1_i1:1303-2136(-)